MKELLVALVILFAEPSMNGERHVKSVYFETRVLCEQARHQVLMLWKKAGRSKLVAFCIDIKRGS